MVSLRLFFGHFHFLDCRYAIFFAYGFPLLIHDSEWIFLSWRNSWAAASYTSLWLVKHVRNTEYLCSVVNVGFFFFLSVSLSHSSSDPFCSLLWHMWKNGTFFWKFQWTASFLCLGMVPCHIGQTEMGSLSVYAWYPVTVWVLSSDCMSQSQSHLKGSSKQVLGKESLVWNVYKAF